MKRIRIYLAFLFAALFITSCQMASKDDVVTVEIDDKIKTCLKLTNDFRTGSEAWYWNKDNTTKTNLVGKLGKLTLDEELCKAAKIRSEEIVKKF